MSTPTRSPRPPAPAHQPRTSTTIAARRIADAPTYAPGYAPVSPAAAASTRILPKAPAAPVAEPSSRIHPAAWVGLGSFVTLLGVVVGFWIWHG